VLAAVFLIAPAAHAGAEDAGVPDAGVADAGPEEPIAVWGAVVSISGGASSINVSPLLEWLEDPAGDLSVEEIAAAGEGRSALTFERRSEDVPHFGYTESTYWARGTLVNAGDVRRSLILELAYPLIDHFDIHVRRQGGEWEERRGGDALPFGERELAHRNVAFALELEPDEAIQVVLRFQSGSSMQLPLVLWAPAAYTDDKLGEQIGYGFLFGILLVMVLYHLFLFIPTRQRSYLYYCLYIADGAVVLGGLSGHSFQYLWPDLPQIEQRVIPLLILSWIVTSSVSTRSFLRTWETARRCDRALLAVIAAAVPAAAFALFGSVGLATTIATGLCCVTAGVTTVTGFAAWASGFRAARFFVLAWLVFAVGVLTYAFKSLGLVPSTALTQQAMNLGTAVETVLISLALGDYIHALRRDQERARRVEALEVSERGAKLSEIRVLAGSLSEVSQVMSGVMERLGRSSHDVAAALAEANSTVAEIERSAASVADTAARIAGETRTRSADFGRGRSAMDSTASAIARARGESERIAAMSNALFTHVEEIDDVVGLVRSVSEQSKVLAVNASIEAANAGQIGKGFGVIAGEVNNLAQQSTEATAHVTGLLVSIRRSLAEIVEAARHGAEQTQEGAAAIENVQAVVEEIGESVSASAAQANQIAASIAEQTSGLTNILAAMERIGRTAAENLEATAGTERAAKDVERTVERLRGIVRSWGGTDDALQSPPKR
jgi:methyl-accepting chemotaxis protein